MALSMHIVDMLFCLTVLLMSVLFTLGMIYYKYLDNIY